MKRKLFLTLLAGCFFSSIFAGSNAIPYSKLTTIGSGMDGCIMFTIGTKIYIGNGGGLDFWVYNPDSNTVRKLGNMPGVDTSRSFGVGFAIGNYGYIGMGDDGSALKHDFWKYNPATNQWTQKADFPGIAGDGFGTFVLGNTAYVFGGSDNAYVYNQMYAYNPGSNKWTQKNPVDSAVIFPSCFVLNGNAYWTGGQGNNEIRTLYEYDTLTDTWAQKAPFPGHARQTAISFSINNIAYVGLGQSQYTTVFSDFFRYDPVADYWNRIDSFTGGARAWSSAAVSGSTAYFGFGWDFVHAFDNDLWSFDASEATGIQQNSQSGTFSKIWPNPASNFINISLGSNNLPSFITIADMQGRTLISETAPANCANLQADISSLQSGIYLMRISNNEGTSTKKFEVK